MSTASTAEAAEAEEVAVAEDGDVIFCIGKNYSVRPFQLSVVPARFPVLIEALSVLSVVVDTASVHKPIY